MELRLEHLVKDFSGTKAVNDVSITIQDGKLTWAPAAAESPRHSTSSQGWSRLLPEGFSLETGM